MGGVVDTSIDVLSKQVAFDFDFINRNVRDLALTVQSLGGVTTELQELHSLAFSNLKAQMAPDKPLALDPALVLEAYGKVSSLVIQVLEARRKAAETIMKARALVDVPTTLLENGSNGILEDGDAFSEDVSKASLSSATGNGIYGRLGVGDPVVSVE